MFSASTYQIPDVNHERCLQPRSQVPLLPFSLGNGRKRNPENEEGMFVDAASVPFVNGRCHFLLKRMKIATQGGTRTIHVL